MAAMLDDFMLCNASDDLGVMIGCTAALSRVDLAMSAIEHRRDAKQMHT